MIAKDDLAALGFNPYGVQGGLEFTPPGKTLPALIVRFREDGGAVLTVVGQHSLAALPVDTVDEVKKMMGDLGLDVCAQTEEEQD